MSDILLGRELPRGIAGWYYQQFLKLQYARVCQDKYYMSWEGDTTTIASYNSVSVIYSSLNHNYYPALAKHIKMNRYTYHSAQAINTFFPSNAKLPENCMPQYELKITNYETKLMFNELVKN